MDTEPSDPPIELGQELRRHRTRKIYLVTALLLFLCLISAAAFVAVPSYCQWDVAPSAEKLAVGLLVTLPFFAGAVAALLWLFARIRRVVILYEGGLVYRDASGEVVIPWRSVEGVYQKIVRVYRAGEEVDLRDEHTIALVSGERITINYQLEGIDALGGAITAAVSEALLPGARRAFQAGEMLDFGPIMLDRGGVRSGEKTLTWEEVDSLSWKAGILASDRAYLMVRKKKGLLAWVKIPIEEIKNYQILMAIAGDLGKVE